MPALTRVIPAILTESADELNTMVRQAEGFAKWLQLDIMDGSFVPSHSIACDQTTSVDIKLGWEAHLMVQNPEELFECFQEAGAKKVIFHYEATGKPEVVIAKARELGLRVGLAVNPETSVAEILPLAEKVDSVLFMAVHPGFYGATFLPEVLEKIAEFRRERPGMEIGIDGGVKEENISLIANSGVDIIYVGSAIFLDENPAESYERLHQLAISKKVA